MCAFWFFISSALAEDRFDSIHMDKHCGPVPWEAYQVASFASKGGNSQEVGVAGGDNVLTQSVNGSVTVKNGKTFEHEGESVALPINGEQWTAMYLTYMSCVVRVNKGDDVENMWKDALKAGTIKDVKDISEFMRAANTLMNPAADAWWTQFKALMDNEFVGENAKISALAQSADGQAAALEAAQQAQAAQQQKIKDEIKRVDDLYSDVKELREHYIALQAAYDSLKASFDEFKQNQSTVDDQLGERLKKIESHMDDLDQAVKLLQGSLQDKAANS